MQIRQPLVLSSSWFRQTFLIPVPDSGKTKVAIRLTRIIFFFKIPEILSFCCAHFYHIVEDYFLETWHSQLHSNSSLRELRWRWGEGGVGDIVFSELNSALEPIQWTLDNFWTRPCISREDWGWGGSTERRKLGGVGWGGGRKRVVRGRKLTVFISRVNSLIANTDIVLRYKTENENMLN